MIKNLPIKSLKENTYYFWKVSNPDWDGGARRVMKKYKNAKYLSNLVGWTVEWDENQERPPLAKAGTQAALIYGGKRK